MSDTTGTLMSRCGMRYANSGSRSPAPIRETDSIDIDPPSLVDMPGPSELPSGIGVQLHHDKEDANDVPLLR